MVSEPLFLTEFTKTGYKWVPMHFCLGTPLFKGLRGVDPQGRRIWPPPSFEP